MPRPQSRTHALAALCFASAALPAAGSEIPFREVWGYGVVVPVSIQGLGPFDFFLDTGADVTVVREDLAGRVGLVATDRVAVSSIGGRRLVAQASVGALALGPIALGPMDVLVHDMRAARADDARLVGILGRNALRGVSFTIDHARRRVIVAAAPGADGQVAPVQVGGRPVIDAHLRCAGEPLRLALDSGIGGIVLFEGERPLPLTLPDRVTARTNLGDAALRAGRLEALCVGPARLVDVPVAVQAHAAAGAPPEDGLLPTRLFARVHFDARRNEVRIEPW